MPLCQTSDYKNVERADPTGAVRREWYAGCGPSAQVVFLVFEGDLQTSTLKSSFQGQGRVTPVSWMFRIGLRRAKQRGLSNATFEQGNLILFAKLTVLGNDLAKCGISLDVHSEQVVDELGSGGVVCPFNNLLFNQPNQMKLTNDLDQLACSNRWMQC